MEVTASQPAGHEEGVSLCSEAGLTQGCSFFPNAVAFVMAAGTLDAFACYGERLVPRSIRCQNDRMLSGWLLLLFASSLK